MNRGRTIFLLISLLLAAGSASAQVVINGDVYGGCNLGKVTEDTRVMMNNGSVEGTIYGGGKGGDVDKEYGAVLGNTNVAMTDGTVERSIYGGGKLGSVGTITYADDAYHASHADVAVGTPLSCAANTGVATVAITGGTVGVPSAATMPPPSPEDDDRGYVFCGSRGLNDADTDCAKKFAVCDATRLTIGGTALVTASVYGGSENGMVLNDTYVHITGTCQIGVGHTGSAADAKYSEEQWTAAMTAVRNGTMGSYVNPFHECSHWDYRAPYATYDPDATKVKLTADGSVVAFDKDLYLASSDAGDTYRTQIANAVGFYYDDGTTSSEGGLPVASDGHTFYGSVFGGGSGYYSYAPGKWRRTAGRVYGNTVIDIDGGHILTNVYGGNEQTDVIGSSTINMSGGTIGVPRSLDSVVAHPVTCYLFGGCKGDQRVLFNEWSNVGSVEVNITGGLIFGSAFGGGEDGHVLGDVELNIGNTVADAAYHEAHPAVEVGVVIARPFIGTQGLSYVDGNVFGGGRGFSGDAITAGAVCGNIEVNISGGNMLGSVYGGGRMASVGTYLAPVNDDEHYGKMQDGVDHGFVKVNISGGTIGNTAPYVYFTGDKPASLRNATYDSMRVKVTNAMHQHKYVKNILIHTTSGNVFGGSMGRVTKLDGTTNPVWPDLARCKKTRVTISDSARILSSVYGGGELGFVIDSTTVNILGGEIGSRIAPSETALKTALRDYSNPGRFADYFYNTDPSDTGYYAHDYLKKQHAFIKDYIDTTYTADPHYYYGSVYGGGHGSMDTVRPAVDLDVNHSYELIHYNAPNHLPPVGIAGRVYGNTYVNIRGGVIRSNVYGGGNIASVGTDMFDASDKTFKGIKPGTGNCHVTISNDTAGLVITGPKVGPLDFTGMNGNVYAGCKGVDDDPYGRYKQYCNVDSTILTVSGGRIWGSTFGGGADCHLLGSAYTKIMKGAHIGDKGVTEFDGYVFGGGRNYFNTNPHAGRVAGNTRVDVEGGRIMCSVIGGGSMGRVGVDSNGVIATFCTDGVYDTARHGNTVINVSGTTDTVALFAKADSLAYRDFIGTTDTVTVGGVKKVVVYRTAIGTGFGPYLLDCDYSIGDIFGGGKGDTRDTVDVTAGRVMNTYITVTGSPRIMADIYAGGEMGCIGWYDTAGANANKYVAKTGYTHLSVSGTPYIGTPYEFSTDNFRAGVTWSIVDPHTKRLLHTCSGNVYGGGQGYVCDGYSNWVSMGRVRQTYVTINGVRMLGHVIGGGSRGVVMEDTYVKVTGGKIGCVITDTVTGFTDSLYHYGCVYGGGYGNPADTAYTTRCDSLPGYDIIPVGYAGRVYGNTHVDISGGQVMDCVFGGGDLASVGYVERYTEGKYAGEYNLNDISKRHNGVCNVNISGNAIIGSLDSTGHNAYVYGAGRGRAYDPSGTYAKYCNVNTTIVTVDLTTTGAYDVTADAWVPATHGGRIWGSIFGGGPDAHVLDSANVEVKGGLIGTTGVTTWDGNIFGGGRNFFNSNHTNGRVQGNIYVTMSGGHILGSIFGGGRMALSGVDTGGHFPTANWDPKRHGNVKVEVSGTSKIGTPDYVALLECDESVGDIFGSGKGDTKNYDDIWAGRVTNTEIEVTGTPRIYGCIIGGGEMASVGYWPGPSSFTSGTGETKVYVYGSPTIGTAEEFQYAEDDNPGKWTDYYGGKIVHTCTGNVIGGCQGDVDVTAPHWISMGRSRASTVVIGKSGDASSNPYIMGSVFGGAEQGLVQDSTRVTVNSGTIGTYIYDGTGATSHYYVGNVYGGGYGSDEFNAANDSSLSAGMIAGRVYGTTQVDIKGGHIYRNVYGGGSMANVGWVDVYVPANSPRMHTPAGDSASISWPYFFDYDNPGHGYTKVKIEGGRIGVDGNDNGKVFGASRGRAGDRYPMSIFASLVGDSVIIDYSSVTDDPAAIASTCDTNMKTGCIVGSVYGGGENGHVYDSAVVVLKSGVVGGSIYGGGCGTDKYIDSLFVKKGNKYVKDTVSVHDVIAGKVYGHTIVQITGGHVYQNVYGGGEMGSIGKGNYHDIGETDRFINDSYEGVAGKGHRYTTGKAEVHIYGGTIGTAVGTYGDVFGAGKGAYFHQLEDTIPYNQYFYYNRNFFMGFANNTDVIIGNASDASSGPTVYGSVYGGGESGRVRFDTKVTVNKGTVHGSVYGGGEGVFGRTDLAGTDGTDKNSGSVFGSTEVNILGGSVQDVYGGCARSFVGLVSGSGLATGSGNTLVNIGNEVSSMPVGDATVGGKVFGANNLAGTAYGNTNVHIYKTAHTTGNPIAVSETTVVTGNQFPTGLKLLHESVDTLDMRDLEELTDAQREQLDDTVTHPRFAIKEVYGGGNHAAHTPTADDGTTLVHVHYCEENTIANVYGGGNAADTKNNSVIIEGGHMLNVFGGGNGSGVGNPGANVSGNATTQILGGLVHNVYGGSNEVGTVSGTTTVSVNSNDDGCDQLVENIFGGGNAAEGGSTSLTIACGTGYLGNVYGGSNDADIDGDVELNIYGGIIDNAFGGVKGGDGDPRTITGNVTVNVYGGEITNVFGGCDSKGFILGDIEVNVIIDSSLCCCQQNLDYVYGGGRNAPYKPTDINAASPRVNIIRGTVNHDVYGGGYGADAIVSSNPVVTVGGGTLTVPTCTGKNPCASPCLVCPNGTESDDYEPGTTTLGSKAYYWPVVGGNVFGGGSLAPVKDSASPAKKKYSTTVKILNASVIEGGVYGGGNAAEVSGNTDVIIDSGD